MENNDKNKMTVWQRLQNAFGPNALLNQDYPTYKFDKKETYVKFFLSSKF